MFTIDAFFYVYNIKLVRKIVIRLLKNSHYRKFVLRSSDFLRKSEDCRKTVLRLFENLRAGSTITHCQCLTFIYQQFLTESGECSWEWSAIVQQNCRRHQQNTSYTRDSHSPAPPTT